MEIVEKDIRPEDFKEGTVWKKMASAKTGAEALLILSIQKGGDKIHVPDLEFFLRGKREREKAEIKNQLTPS